MYQKSILPNGLRVITVPMPRVESVSICIFVKAGSRFESKKINGLSHFLEHLCFKGTKKYKNHKKIARTIEGLGGITNAATDVETTYFWVKVLKPNFARGFDVISDVVLNPTLRSDDIERERDVIMEEIKRYEDLPENKVWDVFIETVWPKHVLGQSVLGKATVINSLKRSDFLHYRRRFYTPSNMVIAAAGNISHEKFLKFVEQKFSHLKRLKIPPIKKKPSSQRRAKHSVLKKSTEQAYLFLGVRGLHINHKDKYTLGVLSSLLGEGLSSRLFIKIREELGLAYYIRTYAELYQDSGVFGVHAGVALAKTEEAIKEILKQLKIIKYTKVTRRELKEAKEKIKGALLFKLESSDQMMMYFGRAELLTQKVLTIDELKAKVEAVTVEDIARLARIIFVNNRLNLAIIGPFESPERFERLLNIE